MKKLTLSLFVVFLAFGSFTVNAERDTSEGTTPASATTVPAHSTPTGATVAPIGTTNPENSDADLALIQSACSFPTNSSSPR